MESKVLACPECGSTRLRSDERATIGYPVVLVRNTLTGAVEPEYTGESYETFDEGTEYSADIWCRGCGANPDEEDLVFAETERCCFKRCNGCSNHSDDCPNRS